MKKKKKRKEIHPFSFPRFHDREATRGLLVGTPCVYGALIGRLVARMPGYLCPEASPPWRKRWMLSKKRPPSLSADQSSTDPRPRKVVRCSVGARARYQSKHIVRVRPPVPSSLPPFPFNGYPSSPFATLSVPPARLIQHQAPARRISSRVSCSFPFLSFSFPSSTSLLQSFPSNRRGRRRNKEHPRFLFRASSMFFRFNDSLVVQLPRHGMLRLGSALIPSFRRLFSFRAT